MKFEDFKKIDGGIVGARVMRLIVIVANKKVGSTDRGRSGTVYIRRIDDLEPKPVQAARCESLHGRGLSGEHADAVEGVDPRAGPFIGPDVVGIGPDSIFGVVGKLRCGEFIREPAALKWIRSCADVDTQLVARIRKFRKEPATREVVVKNNGVASADGTVDDSGGVRAEGVHGERTSHSSPGFLVIDRKGGTSARVGRLDVVEESDIAHGIWRRDSGKTSPREIEQRRSDDLVDRGPSL